MSEKELLNNTNEDFCSKNIKLKSFINNELIKEYSSRLFQINPFDFFKNEGLFVVEDEEKRGHFGWNDIKNRKRLEEVFDEDNLSITLSDDYWVFDWDYKELENKNTPNYPLKVLSILLHNKIPFIAQATNKGLHLIFKHSDNSLKHLINLKNVNSSKGKIEEVNMFKSEITTLCGLKGELIIKNKFTVKQGGKWRFWFTNIENFQGNFSVDIPEILFPINKINFLNSYEILRNFHSLSYDFILEMGRNNFFFQFKGILNSFKPYKKMNGYFPLNNPNLIVSILNDCLGSNGLSSQELEQATRDNVFSNNFSVNELELKGVDFDINKVFNSSQIITDNVLKKEDLEQVFLELDYLIKSFAFSGGMLFLKRYIKNHQIQNKEMLFNFLQNSFKEISVDKNNKDFNEQSLKSIISPITIFLLTQLNHLWNFGHSFFKKGSCEQLSFYNFRIIQEGEEDLQKFNNLILLFNFLNKTNLNDYKRLVFSDISKFLKDEKFTNTLINKINLNQNYKLEVLVFLLEMEEGKFLKVPLKNKIKLNEDFIKKVDVITKLKWFKNVLNCKKNNNKFSNIGIKDLGLMKECFLSLDNVNLWYDSIDLKSLFWELIDKIEI